MLPAFSRLIRRTLTVLMLAVTLSATVAAVDGAAHAVVADPSSTAPDGPPLPAGMIRLIAGPCVIDAPRGLERAASTLAARGEPALRQVEADLDARFAAPFRMVLVAPGARDSISIAIDRSAPPWAAGFVAPATRVGAIRVENAGRYPYGTLEAVLAHEGTHVLIHDRVGNRIPLWFDEGLATWEARRWGLEDAWLVSGAVLAGDPPRLATLDRDFHGSEPLARRAYAVSFSFVAWAARTGPPYALREILRRTSLVPFDQAWTEVMGPTLAESELEWRKESVTRYRWIPIVTASSVFWIGLALLAVVGGARKRARARAERSRWLDEPIEPIEETAEGGSNAPAAPDVGEEGASPRRDEGGEAQTRTFLDRIDPGP